MIKRGRGMDMETLGKLLPDKPGESNGAVKKPKKTTKNDNAEHP